MLGVEGGRLSTIAAAGLIPTVTLGDYGPDIASEMVNVSRDGTKCTSFEECSKLLTDGEDIDYDGFSGPIEYLENGRTPDSLRAQQNARDDALANRIAELREQGKSRDEAKRLASEWLETQAALHRLDGIAGGNVTDISRVGDTRINSSLGSQWRSRVGDIDQAVIDFLNNNPGVDMDNTFINVVLR